MLEVEGSRNLKLLLKSGIVSRRLSASEDSRHDGVFESSQGGFTAEFG
jgi:hypothetical protein